MRYLVPTSLCHVRILDSTNEKINKFAIISIDKIKIYRKFFAISASKFEDGGIIRSSEPKNRGTSIFDEPVSMFEEVACCRLSFDFRTLLRD